MATIAENLSRIQSAKTDIKEAIEAKGVTVPSSATIDTYSDYVSQISGGGGTSYETELMGIIDRKISGSLTIPSGVTSIGDYVFSDCSSLTSVNIPSGATSIGNSAFHSCSGLTSITIPDSVTSIGTAAFTNCSGLTRCTIGSGITSIGTYAFYQCTSLTSCTIGSGITSIGANAFSRIAGNNKSFDLSSIDLSNVSPSSSFNCNGIFQNSYIHGNITIPNSLLSDSNSGTSSTCYSLFQGAYCLGNQSLTINIYADDIIIPRNMCQFSNASTVSKGNINIIVHGTPVFLSRQSFRVISGNEVAAQSVTFADCTTPPDAESYGTTSSSPFYGLTGIIYVPSSGLDAWKTKYTGVASRIQAIPT